MTMLLLKRLNVPLDRDVIFLSEAGEEGSSSVGIGYMVNEHFPEIEAEYCLAEGGGVDPHRRRGEVRDRADAGEDSARHRAGGARHLRPRIDPAEVERDRPPRRRGREGRRLAAGDPLQRDDRHLLPQARARSRRRRSRSTTATCCRPIRRCAQAADDWLFENEPRHSSMLRTSVSPNIFTGGYRSNVIPSEAKATLDVRALPDEDPAKFLEQVKQVVNDPAVDVRFTGAERAPGVGRRRAARLRGVQGARGRGDADLQRHHAADDEHRRDRHGAAARARACSASASARRSTSRTAPKGFGAHSDQERLLESELHRFVRFNWDVVVESRAGEVTGEGRSGLGRWALRRRARGAGASLAPAFAQTPAGAGLDGARGRDDAALPGGAAARHAATRPATSTSRSTTSSRCSTRKAFPSQIFALDPNRSNIVARLKGNGRKRPLLIMGHTDVVTVDAAKWKFPPFSATRDGGYVYGRGADRRQGQPHRRR